MVVWALEPRRHLFGCSPVLKILLPLNPAALYVFDFALIWQKIKPAIKQALLLLNLLGLRDSLQHCAPLFYLALLLKDANQLVKLIVKIKCSASRQNKAADWNSLAGALLL
jgi:hypothetical protein